MTAPTSNTGVILTEAAAAKAKALLEQEAENTGYVVSESV